MITIRIDIDYPYRSRFRSFIYTVSRIKFGSDYLKNSKIAAGMINDSADDIKAHWFFTPKTLPDHELLRLLLPSKHEVDLHVVNDPMHELELLENTTKRIPRHYTIHGTERLVGRIVWRRFRSRAPKMPKNFPLKSFHDFPTIGVDSLAYANPPDIALKIARERLNAGDVIYFHPIWLFQRGKMNHRGPCYQILRKILAVDSEIETVALRRKFPFTLARDYREYEKDVTPTDKLIARLTDLGADIFTFIERKWCCPITNPQKSWLKASDNIALLEMTSYDEWLKKVGKKTRNMIRKAEKSWIETHVAEQDEGLAVGIWRIYNETPIRQERGFPHYGASLADVRNSVFSAVNSTFIGAYLQQELAGFIQLVHGDNITIISQILSLQKHWDKAVNNALVAKAVEFCAGKGVKWLMYGRVGNHPNLDTFKLNNGCVKYELFRYYIPLTRKGKLATKLGLQRDFKDILPESVKYPLMPVYNWISREKMRIRIRSTQNPAV